MGGKVEAVDDNQPFCEEELIAMQVALDSLMHATTEYPIEYSMGDCEFLFESRDDIALIVDSLADEITQSRRAA